MRIISKHHDYYDCAMKQFRDSSVTFVRKTEEIQKNPFSKTMGNLSQLYSRWTVGTKETYDVTPGIIFFCGTVYPYMSFTDFTTSIDNGPGCGVSYPHLIAFTKEAVMEKTPEFLHVHIKAWFDEGKLYPNYAIMSEKSRSFMSKLNPYFTIKHDEMIRYSIANSIAYYSLEFADNEINKNDEYIGTKVIHYPVLKDKCFFYVSPITDAFQRIQMYLTNELAREKEMKILPVPDKIKAESHGFDKWSFRKEPRKEPLKAR